MQMSSSRFGLAALVSASLSVSLLAPLPAQAGNHAQDWDHLSTGLVLGLGGVALGTTWQQDDPQGFRQGALTFGTTLLVTEALKAAIDEKRPDGSGNDSFPSGHTAAAFAAAGYVSIRYGDDFPAIVPFAYGAAALAGYSRIRADKHHARDVLAGAALGWGMAHVFTTPGDTALSVAPTRDGAAVSFSMGF